jgi:hypothetical protein
MQTQKNLYNLNYYDSFYLRNAADDGTTIYFDAVIDNRKIGRVVYVYNNADRGIHLYSAGCHYKISTYSKAPFQVKMNTIRRNIHKAFDTFRFETIVFVYTAEQANLELRKWIPCLKNLKKYYGSTHPNVQALKLKIVKLQRMFYQFSSGVSA